MINSSKLTLPFKFRLSLFICIFTICLLLTSLVAGFILYKWGSTTASMRIATVIQDLLVFIAPALIISLLITRLPADFLCLRKLPSFKACLITILILLLSIPAMNFIVYCNESIVLPDAFRGLEEWLKQAEENSRNSISILLGTPTIGNLIMSILIVGLLTGLSEELLFRGALQNIIYSKPTNYHLAVWVTAILFSIMHMQFYGIIPRILLGAFFGYLAVWSGSIWLPVIAHSFNNIMVVISTWLITNNTTNVDINKFATEITTENIIFVLISIIATFIAIIKLKGIISSNNKKLTS